jgi:hypothetical protein
MPWRDFLEEQDVAAATGRQIRERAREIVLRHPGGIRFAEIVEEVARALPEANKPTIGAQVANNLVPTYSSELTKPSRGLYKPISSDSASVSATVLESGGLQKEEDVYEPFAEWLKGDIEEATEAVPLGGAGLKSKWGTPDVVGVYRPLASQLIKFTPELAPVSRTPQIARECGRSVSWRSGSGAFFRASTRLR